MSVLEQNSFSSNVLNVLTCEKIEFHMPIIADKMDYLTSHLLVFRIAGVVFPFYGS